MARAGRNDPCPCGSGLKFKRCCGSTRERAEALELRLDAELEAEALPALMPELRPRSASFDAWAATVEEPPETLWNGVLEEGVAAIGAEERGRILAAAAGPPWRACVEDLGDEARAEALLLRGAVAAALRARRAPAPEVFSLLGRVPEAIDNPVALLGVLLNPFDVWDVARLSRLEELDLAEEGVDALWDDGVRERLHGAVEGLAGHVPLGRGAELDRAVLEARAVFASEPQAERELAALLLARAGAFVASGPSGPY